MPLVKNQYTQMTDTGTANGKNGYAKAQKGLNSAGNSKVLNTPKTNPRSPLAQKTLAQQTEEVNRKKAEEAAKAQAGDSNKGNTGGYYSRYRTYSSRGGGTGGAVSEAPVDQGQNLAALAAALQAQKQARIDAINAANAALDKQAEAMRGKYDASLSTLGQDYQKLRNQAEVNRYHAMYNQREALANRGALDSGAGRQENMVLNNNYNNNLNAINVQEAAERANIQRAINEMYANVEQQKAQNMTNGLSDYNSALQDLINAQYSGYTPEGSAYYQQALATLGANSGANDANYLAYLRALGYNV